MIIRASLKLALLSILLALPALAWPERIEGKAPPQPHIVLRPVLTLDHTQQFELQGGLVWMGKEKDLQLRARGPGMVRYKIPESLAGKLVNFETTATVSGGQLTAFLEDSSHIQMGEQRLGEGSRGVSLQGKVPAAGKGDLYLMLQLTPGTYMSLTPVHLSEGVVVMGP